MQILQFHQTPLSLSFLIIHKLFMLVFPDQAKTATRQDIFYRLWEISSDLANGKFVKNVSIYPALQITLVHPDMTREFEVTWSERQRNVKSSRLDIMADGLALTR